MSVMITRAVAGAASDYAYLRHMDRAGWAWEWLRRNPVYRETTTEGPVHQASPEGIIRLDDAAERRAAQWGLCFRRRP